jgi:hypothetical protein
LPTAAAIRIDITRRPDLRALRGIEHDHPAGSSTTTSVRSAATCTTTATGEHVAVDHDRSAGDEIDRTATTAWRLSGLTFAAGAAAAERV